MHKWIRHLFIQIIFFSSTVLFARDIPLNPLTIEKTHLSSSQLAPGANAEVKLNVNLLKDHHAYLEQFRLKADPPGALKIGNLNVKPIVTFYDKFSKKTKKGIKGSATISAVFEVPENVLLGENSYKLQLVYQACTKSYCHLPKTATTTINLDIVSAEDLENGTVVAKKKAQESEFSKVKKKGWLYLILFVFLAGLLTGFTPCIFPMIPITLTVLHGHKKNLTHWQGFIRSCVYVLGIALTYVGLGLFAASTGSLFGGFLGHPIMATFLALIFFAMALSMFGAFEIGLPHFIEKRLLSQKTDASYKGIFIAGLLAGVVASPCVGPVLIGVLTFVAKSQDIVLGAILLFFFALGFGMLFILLGTFGEFIKKMPKAGHWMIEVKELFGWAMLGLAMYYLSPVLSGNYWYMLLGVLLVSFSSIFGAFTPSEKLDTLLSLKKGWMLVIFVIGILFFTRSLLPELFLSSNNAASHKESSIAWQAYSEEVLDQAKKRK